MSRLFIIILLSLFSLSLQARIFVDISMVYKRGVDKQLVLESELHSVEEIWGEKRINLIMNNGTRLVLFVGFWDGPKTEDETNLVGPSSKVFLEGKLLYPDGSLSRDIDKRKAHVRLGEVYSLIIKDKTRLIEILIKPYLK